MLHVPRLQYLALISNKTKKTTQTWQQGCVNSHTLLSNQMKDPSNDCSLQDPRSLYLYLGR